MTILCSVNNRLFNRTLCNVILKNCNLKHQIRLQNSKIHDVHCVEELKNRGLLQISGNEGVQFLQGLITNDMKHLEEGSRSMYTMFLNSKGRVMYDAIIYRNLKKPVIYIECDKSAINDLHKHLKLFKVRRKIDINVIDNYKVWVIFCPSFIDLINQPKEIRVKDVSQEKVVPCQAVDFLGTPELDKKLFESFSQNDDFCVSWDPRVPMLGVRILAEDHINVEKVAKEKGIPVDKSELTYKLFRYKLGIGEGVDELPYGKCFPLEMNCDYLHGVSFHKGCYIGQELTARTHHTGVVRKRLMPIYLDSEVEVDNTFQLDTPIEVAEDKPRAIGKLRGIERNIAIGLVRISDALNATKLKIGHLTGYAEKPQWWPQEAPKESLLSRKE